MTKSGLVPTHNPQKKVGSAKHENCSCEHQIQTPEIFKIKIWRQRDSKPQRVGKLKIRVSVKLTHLSLWWEWLKKHKIIIKNWKGKTKENEPRRSGTNREAKRGGRVRERAHWECKRCHTLNREFEHLYYSLHYERSVFLSSSLFLLLSQPIQIRI